MIFVLLCNKNPAKTRTFLQDKTNNSYIFLQVIENTKIDKFVSVLLYPSATNRMGE